MDGDAFFVAVEIAKNPALRGLPVVTGGERGIATALSYEAKALGVTRGMPVFRIKKEFPQVKILPGDYRAYAEYSRKMFDVVRRYVDDVDIEEYSIDECFAELTGLERPLKMSYAQIAERIQREIRDELRLSISIGVAPTKLLSKVASKFVKPNGLTVIENSRIPDFLTKTPIEKIWGIGWRTAIILQKQGIRTAQDFASKDRTWIREHLAKPHEVIWYELNGTPVMGIDSKPKTIYGSIQKTRTFHPATNDRVFLLSQLSKHVEDACAKARRFDLAPRHISIFLKTRDFTYASCRIDLPAPTNAPEIIAPLVRENFSKIHIPGRGVSGEALRTVTLYRTAGVTLHDLIPVSHASADLFGGTARATKFETVHKQVDALEKKFGKRMVYLASTHSALLYEPDDEISVSGEGDDLLFL